MTSDELARALCYGLGYKPERLFAPLGRRFPHAEAMARRTIAAGLRAQNHSLPEIARALGCRNHTSVLWMLRGGRTKLTDPKQRARMAT